MFMPSAQRVPKSVRDYALLDAHVLQYDQDYYALKRLDRPDLP